MYGVRRAPFRPRRSRRSSPAAIVSGIYAGDPGGSRSTRASPRFARSSAQHGSLLEGCEARAKKRRGRARRRPALLSLAGGLGRIGAGRRDRLGSRLRTGARVVVGRSRGRERPVRARRWSGGVARAHRRRGGGARDARARRGRAAGRSAAAGRGRPRRRSSTPRSRSSRRASGRRTLPGLPAGFRLPGPARGRARVARVDLPLAGLRRPRARGLRRAHGVLRRKHRAPRRSPSTTVTSASSRRASSGSALGLRRAPPRAEILRIVRWKDALPQYDLGHQQRIADAMAHLGRESPGSRSLGTT